MSTSCCTALEPRHQEWECVDNAPDTHSVAVAATPATTCPSTRPWLESIAARRMIDAPEVGRSVYSLSTHCWRSCGVVTPRQSTFPTQLGTSQGGTRVTSAWGPSEGTRVPRAFNVVGRRWFFRGPEPVGTVTSLVVTPSGPPSDGSSHPLPKRRRSCEVWGMQ